MWLIKLWTYLVILFSGRLDHAASHQQQAQWITVDLVYTSKLDDLDFADDIALVSQNQQQMQDNLREVEQMVAETGLHINT